MESGSILLCEFYLGVGRRLGPGADCIGSE